MHVKVANWNYDYSFILTKWYVNSPDPNPPVDPEFYIN